LVKDGIEALAVDGAARVVAPTIVNERYTMQLLAKIAAIVEPFTKAFAPRFIASITLTMFMAHDERESRPRVSDECDEMLSPIAGGRGPCIVCLFQERGIR